MKYGMRLRFLLLFIIFLGALVLPSVVLAQCETEQQCRDQIAELTAKLSQVQKESKTLSDAISVLNLKQSLIQRQIDATQFQIQLLQRDIESLSGKISLLETELNNLTEALLTNVSASYKRRNVDGFQTLVSSRNFSDALAAYKYLSVAQKYRQDLLFKTTQTKYEYDQEKSLKEKKQQEIAVLKKQYEKQKQELIVQQRAKQLLLSQTKNSEANYQRLLAQAEAELAGFRAFTTSKGVGLVSQQVSPDGWYFGQRDERWGYFCINGSCKYQYFKTDPADNSLARVGCLVTSIAMVKKKYGENITPVTIAANPAYYSVGTADMSYPDRGGWPAPSGYRYAYPSGKDLGIIDRELAEGRPVIVKLKVNTNIVGTHFLVLKSGSGGNYVMHDPWEGYDKKFSDFYSIGQIVSMGYLVRN